MNQFEYEITKYAADEFYQITIFCTEQGSCSIEKVPSEQTGKMENIFNTRGKEGWELIQLNFGKDGILAFWKRQVVQQS